MKPYQQIPILECGEPLVPIPPNVFAIEQPHPYQKLGAPYGDRSPYFLRQSVLEHLTAAQIYLHHQYPRWQLQIFDAYRPIAVQQFMVDYTFAQVLRDKGLNAKNLAAAQRQAILEEVYRFWAVPSTSPLMPPPHSTGAAIDVTLIDAQGKVVDMGSAIDERSPRSAPGYYATETGGWGGSGSEAVFHYNRQILQEVMFTAGFCQHPHEWWHFSLGDQMWAWSSNRDRLDTLIVARYGAV